MPKLRETYKQIQERNAREIKQRTRDRLRSLQGERDLVFVEDSSSDCVEDLLTLHLLVENSHTLFTFLLALLSYLFLCVCCCANTFIWLRESKSAA